jgi:aquaporin Z
VDELSTPRSGADASGEPGELLPHIAPDTREALHARAARDAVWVGRFTDATWESRRLFAEVVGTFALVVAGAGPAVVSAATHTPIGRSAAVTAPGLAVLAVILSLGAISGAHLNPVVSLAFTLRGDFPWRRVPGYVLAQLLGATLAALALWAIFGKVGSLGATVPGRGVGDLEAVAVEALLTAGLVSTILGTASRAQNIGAISAFGVAAYIALAGLWSSPATGASMNPARSFGPDLALADFSDYWIYVAGPLIGALLAVGASRLLRGRGGRDPLAARAAQGAGEVSDHGRQAGR